MDLLKWKNLNYNRGLQIKLLGQALYKLSESVSQSVS